MNIKTGLMAGAVTLMLLGTVPVFAVPVVSKGGTCICTDTVPFGQHGGCGFSYQRTYDFNCFTGPTEITSLSFESNTAFSSENVFSKVELGTTNDLGPCTLCCAFANNFASGPVTVFCSETTPFVVSNNAPCTFDVTVPLT